MALYWSYMNKYKEGVDLKRIPSFIYPNNAINNHKTIFIKGFKERVIRLDKIRFK